MTSRILFPLPLRSALLAFVAVELACAVVLAWVYWPLEVWLHYPLQYNGDGFWNLFMVKTVLQTGWYTGNPSLGAPFGAIFLDFAKPESLYLLFFRISGCFTDNVALVHNLFYFLGFFMVAGAALAVLRNGFGLPWVLAGAGALLYTFLPFHFLRGGHLFLSNYFVIPLAVWLVLQVSAERMPFFESGRLGMGRWSVWLAAALLASTSIYYAFFGLYLIFAAGALESIRTRRKHHFLSGVLVCALVGGLVLANLAPSLLYRAQEGANEKIAARSMPEIEMYALRPIQLLLPLAEHRISAVAELTRKYEADAPFLNENKTAALGVVGSAGFLMLILALFAGHRSLESRPQFGVAARVNVLALALSVAGGVGAMVGLMLSPQFRALNRISVVIAFVSIAALMTCVDRAVNTVSDRWRRPLLLIVAALVLFAGLLDQVPLQARPDATAIASQYERDRSFVQKIEASLPPHAQILQLPYISFPEPAQLNKETPYSHLRGFIHSKFLRWSYGGMKGREGDAWHEALTQLPLAEQVRIARESGFAGIWLDRKAMQDGGKELEKGLRSLGLSGAYESKNRKLVLYPLSPTGNDPPALLSAPILGKGFYEWEGIGENRWVWTRGDASFSLVWTGKNPQRVRIAFSLNSLTARSISVLVGEQMLDTFVLTPGLPRNVDYEIILPPGRSAVRFTTDMPAVVQGNSDRRQLAMSIGNVRLAPAQSP